MLCDGFDLSDGKAEWQGDLCGRVVGQEFGKVGMVVWGIGGLCHEVRRRTAGGRELGAALLTGVADGDGEVFSLKLEGEGLSV